MLLNVVLTPNAVLLQQLNTKWTKKKPSAPNIQVLKKIKYSLKMKRKGKKRHFSKHEKNTTPERGKKTMNVATKKQQQQR